MSRKFVFFTNYRKFSYEIKSFRLSERLMGVHREVPQYLCQ